MNSVLAVKRQPWGLVGLQQCPVDVEMINFARDVQSVRTTLKTVLPIRYLTV